MSRKSTKSQTTKVMEEARELGCNKKMAKLIRIIAEPEFTTSGIKNKYGRSYYSWMNEEADAIIGAGKLDILNLYNGEATAYNRGDAPEPEQWLASHYPELLNGEPAEPIEPAPVAPAPVAPAEPPQPEPQPEPQPQKNDLQSTVQFSFPQHMVTEAVRQLAPTLQADVKNEIREAAKELKGHVIKLPSGKEIHLEGTKHKNFQKATTLTNMHRQLFMAGPTGSGKTFLSEQVAEGLGLSFNHISCTVGMSEAHITGRMTATGEYVGTAFVEAYEKGGVFLFDEVDAADPNVLLIINSALSNGKISLPNRPEAPVAKRHKDCIIICAANTWGHGSADYTGREMLDRAFLDRFAMSRIHLDYDTELERDLTDKSSLTERLQSIRQKVDRPVSTRAILDAHRMSDTFSEQEIMEIFTMDWTSEEKAKAEI